MKYSPVIGLEVHVELNTKTKMFCGCSADYFGKEPNSYTCPVCLGLPGALPYANQEALEKCMMIGLALNCKVSKNSRFERKNYFYPDLPKGYQISQYRWPLCTAGSWQLSSGQLVKINRVHIEEDTGKLSHLGGVTNIDFNRSGVPLVEIVTEPDFETVNQVVEFAKKLQQVVKDLGVSNADMERGDFRLEANVSLRTQGPGAQGLPDYRIELKNINSFRFMQQAIEYEIERQCKLLEQGATLHKETRGWDEDKKITYAQREKEEAHDYRYFPEPDLPEVVVSNSDREKVKAKTPQLSSQKVSDLAEKYGIPEPMARTLVSQGMADYFEKVVKEGEEQEPKTIANVIVNKRIPTDLSPEEFIGKLREGMGLQGLSDEDLEIAVVSVIKHNERAAQDFKNGRESVIQFLVGLVMKETKGKASADKARELIVEKLQNG